MSSEEVLKPVKKPRQIKRSVERDVHKWIEKIRKAADSKIDHRNKNITKKKIGVYSLTSEKSQDQIEEPGETRLNHPEVDSNSSSVHSESEKEELPSRNLLSASQKPMMKKTALHQRHIMDWLARYEGRVKVDYLFLPREKKKRQEFHE